MADLKKTSQIGKMLDKYIGGLLSQRTIILTIIGLARLRAHICTICECMRDFFILMNSP